MNEYRKKTADLIDNMSYQELQDFYSRYCPPDRRIIACKKLKVHIDVKYVEEQLTSRGIEEILLIQEKR